MIIWLIVDPMLSIGYISLSTEDCSDTNATVGTKINYSKCRYRRVLQYWCGYTGRRITSGTKYFDYGDHLTTGEKNGTVGYDLLIDTLGSQNTTIGKGVH